MEHKYPGGMIGGVPAFNAANRSYVEQGNTTTNPCGTLHGPDDECGTCYDRNLENEAAWDAAATDATIRTQGQLIEELKQQLTDQQNAYTALLDRYNTLCDAAGEVTFAHTWNEPMPGIKIDALSALLTRQANAEDDQC